MKQILFRIKESIWFQPAIYSTIAIILSLSTSYFDTQLMENYEDYIPTIFLTQVDLAQIILGGLSTALLTMTTFTFSTIMVVLTTYSSQFSPRTMKNFVEDRMTWRVLGIFMGGFIYTTLSLLFMRESIGSQAVISATIGVFLALICLVFFGIFINHIAKNIQLNQLTSALVQDGRDAVNYYFDFMDKQPVKISTEIRLDKENAITAQQNGYIQYFDYTYLHSFAEKNGCKVKLMKNVGQYVTKGDALLLTDHGKVEDVDSKRFVALGADRSTSQDPAYAVEKFVEIALRAISPGINDPNTARHTLLHIGELIGRISRLPDDHYVMHDDQQKPTLSFTYYAFDRILYRTYYQLRQYGKSDISILAAMTDSLMIAADMAPEGKKKDLWEIQKYLIEGMESSSFYSLDFSYYQEKVDELAAKTNQPTIQAQPFPKDDR